MGFLVILDFVRAFTRNTSRPLSGKRFLFVASLLLDLFLGHFCLSLRQAWPPHVLVRLPSQPSPQWQNRGDEFVAHCAFANKLSCLERKNSKCAVHRFPCFQMQDSCVWLASSQVKPLIFLGPLPRCVFVEITELNGDLRLGIGLYVRS